MVLQPGVLLQGGKYRIEKVLGQGGFGITYLAEQTNLGRKVCIKEFFMKEYGERISTPSGEADATVLTGVTGVTSAAAAIMGRYREKFVKEARTIAKLDHPGIVRIHDVFEENGTAYYVMDYIEGDNLNDLVNKAGPLSEERALFYIHQVADALNYIHGKSIMHLDVKPSNIIIQKSEDRVVLIDFGTAKQYDLSGSQTSTTPVGLSAGYAPIELMKAEGVQSFSPETDVYSLGATLYYLVTGQNPPEASDVLDDGLPEMPDKLSSSLRNAIEAAMKPRKLRPQSVGAFLELLNARKRVEYPGEKTGERPEISIDTLPKNEAPCSKKLYRDMERKRVAGVCAGLSHFISVDVAVVRIILIVALVAGTIGLWVYLVMWIAIPKAKTPLQKCAMLGIPATVDNLEHFNSRD